MTSPRRKVDFIVSGIIVAICAYQLANVTYNNIYPPVPEIIIKDKTLEEIEFPICFLLCLNEIQGEDSPRKYTKYGYKNVELYFSGGKNASFGWSNKSTEVFIKIEILCPYSLASQCAVYSDPLKILVTPSNSENLNSCMDRI